MTEFETKLLLKLDEIKKGFIYADGERKLAIEY